MTRQTLTSLEHPFDRKAEHHFLKGKNSGAQELPSPPTQPQLPKDCLWEEARAHRVDPHIY